MLRVLARRAAQITSAQITSSSLARTRSWVVCAAGAMADTGVATTAASPSRRRRTSLSPSPAALAQAEAEGGDAAAAAAGDQAAQRSPRKRAKTGGGGGGGGAPTPKKAKAPRKKAAAADADTDADAAHAAGGAGDVGAEGAAAAAAAAASPKAKKAKTKLNAAQPFPAGPLYDASMRAPRYDGPAHRFISWNVAGVRALLRKDARVLKQLVERELVDAVCIQEHKLQEAHVQEVVRQVGLEGWHTAFNCSVAKKGYSGTATFTRHKPLSTRLGIGHVEHDDEGRVVTVELPELWLLNVYTPNSGEGLKRLEYRTSQWDKALAGYIKGLCTGAGGKPAKPVVVLGDLNCAHQPLDIYDPKRHTRSAGFTDEERESFSCELLGGAGLVDAWRAQHPGVVGYTYYSFRGPNGGMRKQGKGWRLDYTLVSEDLAPHVHDAYILKDVEHSDHCPLGIVIKKDASG